MALYKCALIDWLIPKDLLKKYLCGLLVWDFNKNNNRISIVPNGRNFGGCYVKVEWRWVKPVTSSTLITTVACHSWSYSHSTSVTLSVLLQCCLHTDAVCSWSTCKCRCRISSDLVQQKSGLELCTLYSIKRCPKHQQPLLKMNHNGTDTAVYLPGPVGTCL